MINKKVNTIYSVIFIKCFELCITSISSIFINMLTYTFHLGIYLNLVADSKETFSHRVP